MDRDCWYRSRKFDRNTCRICDTARLLLTIIASGVNTDRLSKGDKSLWQKKMAQQSLPYQPDPVTFSYG